MQKRLKLREISVKEAAEYVDGEIQGDESATFRVVGRIEDAPAGSLSFLANPKYLDHIYRTGATVVLVNRDLELREKVPATLIKVEDAYIAFCKILNEYFNPSLQKKGIEGNAMVTGNANVGDDCYIGHGAYIGENSTVGHRCKIYPNVYVGDNVTIGDDTIVYANASIYAESRIGRRVIIHSGAVIGADGFGHARQKDGSYVKIPQIGNVVIEDDVEIGSNTTIDRATMGSTVVRKGVKLDNLIMIAHNVEIGAHTVIAGQSGISGSTKLGEYCVIGGQVGFAGHLKVAGGSQIGAQSGISKDIEEENKQWFGTPIMPVKDALRNYILIKSLPGLKERVDKIEKKVDAISDK